MKNTNDVLLELAEKQSKIQTLQTESALLMSAIVQSVSKSVYNLLERVSKLENAQSENHKEKETPFKRK